MAKIKIWHSMQDELVRDTHADLDGETVYITDVFHSSGAEADCPGDFGEPGEDINCRCFLEYSLMTAKEFLDSGGKLPEGLTYDADSGMITGGEDAEEAEENDEVQVNMLPTVMMIQMMQSRVLVGESSGGAVDMADSPHDVLLEMIESGKIKVELNHEKQAKHFRGTREYRSGNGYWYIPEEEIAREIEEKHGTGYICISSDGQIKETILLDTEKAGMYKNALTKEEEETNAGTIHYSKTGTHLVPARKQKRGEQ